MELFASYTGGDFLTFYGGLIIATVIAGLWIPMWLRPEGRDSTLSDPAETAYLAGGHTRFVDSVIAGLLARGGLQIAGKTKLAVKRPEMAQSAAEQALVRVPGNFSWSKARKTIGDYTGKLDASLVRKGLLIEPGERWLMRVMPLVPYVAVLALGFYRREAGAALGEPVGYLTMMMLAVVVLGFIRLVRLNPATQAGNNALAEARRLSGRLRNAPTQDETGMAVSLFGTAVLVGSPYASYHQMRSSSGDGSSSGGDGDGGGCGGGGCGGCGG